MPLIINQDGFIHDGYSHKKWCEFMQQILPDHLTTPNNYGYPQGIFNLSNVIREYFKNCNIKGNVEILDVEFDQPTWPTFFEFELKREPNFKYILELKFNNIGGSIEDYNFANLNIDSQLINF